MVSVKWSESGTEICTEMCMDPFDQKSATLSTLLILGYVWVHTETSTVLYTECYVLCSFLLTGRGLQQRQ